MDGGRGAGDPPPDLPPVFSPPPFQGGGREGGPAPGCAGVPSASRETRTRMRAFGPPGRRDAGAPRQSTDERDRKDPPTGPPSPWVNPPPDLPPSRGEERRPRGEELESQGVGRLGGIGIVGREARRRRLLSSPRSSLPPPFRGEVGRGVPPPGAPASRRPRAKRERGCGPSVRQAGGTPALPGSSRTSGTVKVPDRAAEPLGQPPSRPPPFQGGGEKTQGGGVGKSGRRAARRHRYRRAGSAPPPPSLLPPVFSPPPFRGEVGGGPAPGCAGVPSASRETRTRVRAFGPPCRRDAGAPRQSTDERDREGPRPGRRASGSTPLPTSPLPGGRREDPGGRSWKVRASGASPTSLSPGRTARPVSPFGHRKTGSRVRLPWRGMVDSGRWIVVSG